MSQVLEARAPVTYQDYSVERKAEVLALVQANGGNVKRTADQTGIHHATIQYWIANPNRLAGIQQHKVVELAEKLENIANQCADLLPAMLPAASVREVVGAMGQSIEKMQLLRGEPTSITGSAVSEEERQAKLNGIFERIQARAVDAAPAEAEQPQNLLLQQDTGVRSDCITDGTDPS